MAQLMPRKVFVLLAGLALFVATVATGFAAGGMKARESTVGAIWSTNGVVNALAVSGHTLFVGGSFTQVGPRTGPLVAVSASSGARDSAFPEAAGGPVVSIVEDG